nr:MAG TPA: hypothetical protein [Caudoviricetes sp.]
MCLLPLYLQRVQRYIINKRYPKVLTIAIFRLRRL